MLNAKMKDVIHSLYREMSLLENLDHENIVQYLGYDYDVEKGYILIFFEYVPGHSQCAEQEWPLCGGACALLYAANLAWFGVSPWSQSHTSGESIQKVIFEGRSSILYIFYSRSTPSIIKLEPFWWIRMMFVKLPTSVSVQAEWLGWSFWTPIHIRKQSVQFFMWRPRSSDGCHTLPVLIFGRIYFSGMHW